tara:strand:+ start:36009 stop:36164 length:156 start_codon:yes stop_codon:yes gene_type:complete
MYLFFLLEYDVVRSGRVDPGRPESTISKRCVTVMVKVPLKPGKAESLLNER